MTEPDWRTLARALADGIIGEGGDREWADVVAAVPRHLFVPVHHVQSGGVWQASVGDESDRLVEVYRDQPLVTELMRGHGNAMAVVSSSTKPGLMVRMLAALDLADGHDVLEIGTGTGYNAALLCQRLGAARVTSVDVGASLVEAARQRLGRLGHAPVLVAADGTAALAGHGPFDRIVATCSVPAIPEAWFRSLRPGGAMLADLKIGLHAGSLVLLRRCGDALRGRFLPRWAGFMPARHADRAPDPVVRGDRGSVEHASTTLVDPDPWSALVPWFLAQLVLPPVTHFGRRGPDLATTLIEAADGAWCEIGPAGAAGGRTVRGGGGRDVWAGIEEAHQRWAGLGRPAWDRFGLTVGPGGQHIFWLDDPGHVLGSRPG